MMDNRNKAYTYYVIGSMPYFFMLCMIILRLEVVSKENGHLSLGVWLEKGRNSGTIISIRFTK